MNRRNLLGLAGLSALAMAGCSSTPTNSGTSTNVNKLDAILPKYQALDLVKPDITVPPPAANGYLSYPSNLVKAISAKPGKGGAAIKVTTLNWGAVPPGLGQNSYLAAVNAELGVDMDFNINDGNTYADKLTAILGARDITDILVVPSWNTNVPRFPDAVATLFEDLTDYLKGDAVTKYPMLASFPKGAWQGCVWGGKLSAVPFVSDNPFAWGLFYRKDILDAAGLKPPKTADELYQLGKALTKSGQWAFGDITDYVQMVFGAPGSKGGWRVENGGKVVHKFETPEFLAGLEFAAKLFKEGMVHPDIVGNPNADAGQLFKSGKIVIRQDGLGGWQNTLRDQLKVDPNFKMQPVAVFSHDGTSKPVVWGSADPIFYTFIKKGLGKERTEEILGCLNWCAAPFGTKEWELRQYGVEGKHFTRGSDGVPKTNDTYNNEYANQYTFMSGRLAAITGGSDTPNFVQDYTTWTRQAVEFLEPNPWAGIKIEEPVKLSQQVKPMDDKIKDVVRGRRPVSEWKSIVEEWKRNGGDEGRDFMAKALNA